MSEKNVKRLMIFFIIFLPLQYAIVGIVGTIKSEPWPAFVLPAFKSVFHKSDHFSIDQAKFYVQNNKNGRLKEIQSDKLFTGIPKSQLQGFFRTRFSDSAGVAHFSAETKNWLKNNLIEKTGTNADELEVRWFKQIINPRAPKRSQIKIDKKFTISLQSE